MDKPNMNYIEQLADGDKAFEHQFISILKEELPKEKEVYLKAISANAFDPIQAHVNGRFQRQEICSNLNQ